MSTGSESGLWWHVVYGGMGDAATWRLLEAHEPLAGQVVRYVVVSSIVRSCLVTGIGLASQTRALLSGRTSLVSSGSHVSLLCCLHHLAGSGCYGLCLFTLPKFFVFTFDQTDHRRQFITCWRAYGMYPLLTWFQSSTKMRSTTLYPYFELL